MKLPYDTLMISQNGIPIAYKVLLKYYIENKKFRQENA